jgi:hypothetical protein
MWTTTNGRRSFASEYSCKAVRCGSGLRDPSGGDRVGKNAAKITLTSRQSSILARRLLKRSSFTSLDDLKTRALQFIEYFNSVLAKPFRWTYTGRPLQA